MSFVFLYTQVFACSSEFWPWTAGLMANTTLLLASVLAAGLVARTRNAPLRHLVASLALACLVAMPLLSLSVSWAPGHPPEIRAPWSALGIGASAASSAFADSLPRLLLLTWLLGATAILARMFADLALLRRQTRRGFTVPQEAHHLLALARRAGVRRRVRLLFSGAFDIPCTWGFFRPVILLPRRALDWSAERRTAVLLHELGHIRRWDGIFMTLSRVACALYWFHPLAWWLERTAREDAERACDQFVVEAGVAPERYARHLLEIVRDARRPSPAVVPTMASGSQLARRIANLVGSPRPTRRMPLAGLAAAAVGLLATALLLAALSSPGPYLDTSQGAALECSTPEPMGNVGEEVPPTSPADPPAPYTPVNP